MSCISLVAYLVISNMHHSIRTEIQKSGFEKDFFGTSILRKIIFKKVGDLAYSAKKLDHLVPGLRKIMGIRLKFFILIKEPYCLFVCFKHTFAIYHLLDFLF